MNKSRERALAALIANPTHEGAAKAAGISARTLRRYLQDDEFREEYGKRCAALVTEASSRLMRSTGVAIDALLRVAGDEDAPQNAQVSAGRALLDFNLRYSESRSMQAAARASDVPVFYYLPGSRDAPISAETYAEVERILNEPPTIFLGVEPKRYEPNEGNEDEQEIEA